MFSSERMPQLFEVVNTFHFQICLAHYTALQMRNVIRRAFAINPVIAENRDDLCYKRREAIMCYHESTLQEEMEWTKVHKSMMLYCSMTKGTCPG